MQYIRNKDYNNNNNDDDDDDDDEICDSNEMSHMRHFLKSEKQREKNFQFCNNLSVKSWWLISGKSS